VPVWAEDRNEVISRVPSPRVFARKSPVYANAQMVDFYVTCWSTSKDGRMKFVSSREIRVNPKPVFDAAGEGEEVVITSRGKPVALLVGVSGDDLEETVRLFRRAKAQAAVSRMRGAAAREGLSSMNEAEIEAEVAAVRSKRASR
jgi:prevent-host-death family protein